MGLSSRHHPSYVAGPVAQDVGHFPADHHDLAARDSYHLRRERTRFTCEMFHHDLRDLGVPATTEPAWVTAVLIELLPT